MKPNTGNSDCDRWIATTFVREEKESCLTGAKLPTLRIKAIPAETVLDEDQLRGLIRYLTATFCMACGGDGFDPDTLDGRCEYCNANLPF